ncbi:gamma-glutamyl transpeptidase 4 [Actinidia rufa]|uniref:Gamma-glutamyl transpeptidase 4 n=1 Tax=Actinidia rufa TaxID=165716 RepID=A0A7J0DJ67_9ERIC|nr:gamma-glutamyl transpeptidase 4 [Actinidia rufa]
MGQKSTEVPLLGSDGQPNKKHLRRVLLFFLAFLAITFVGLSLGGNFSFWKLGGNDYGERIQIEVADIVESDQAVVAADDGRCSEIGASVLRQGGHAVDAAVATALCLGVVNPMASGVGGGAFMIVRSSSLSQTLAFDMRETAPLASSQDMYENNSKAKYKGPLSIGVPGMPPPSSGTLGLSLVLNILDSYGNANAAKGSLGLHRLIEALKHMFSVRMNLGDPDFVNISNTISDMLSPSYAKKLRLKIFDNTTFPPEYYMYRWSQLRDHGTSHFCIVDADRNAVSMTTTINYGFGAGLLSPSTGVIMNNEMGDFSIPTEVSPDSLPPAPTNFIKPNKRPLSSMTPIIVLKDNQLAGVIGGSGGMNIIPAVIQVFLNHFILGMEPLAAVQNPRVYHKLIPNVVSYENWTVIDGDHIELPDVRRHFLEERGHQLQAKSGGGICQLVVQTLGNGGVNMGRKQGKISSDQIFHGTLTAVSDPRKDGRPAAV